MKQLQIGISLGLAIAVGAGWYAGAHRAVSTNEVDGYAVGAGISVGVASVSRGDVPIVLKALGTVTPLATVIVKTQITGQLVQVAFTEDQDVKKGDLLAVVDPRPYVVALQQAQGTLEKDQALLKNAQIDLQRYKTLVAQDS